MSLWDQGLKLGDLPQNAVHSPLQSPLEHGFFEHGNSRLPFSLSFSGLFSLSQVSFISMLVTNILPEDKMPLSRRPKKIQAATEPEDGSMETTLLHPTHAPLAICILNTPGPKQAQVKNPHCSKCGPASRLPCKGSNRKTPLRIESSHQKAWTIPCVHADLRYVKCLQRYSNCNCHASSKENSFC